MSRDGGALGVSEMGRRRWKECVCEERAPGVVVVENVSCVAVKRKNGEWWFVRSVVFGWNGLARDARYEIWVDEKPVVAVQQEQ